MVSSKACPTCSNLGCVELGYRARLDPSEINLLDRGITHPLIRQRPYWLEMQAMQMIVADASTPICRV